MAEIKGLIDLAQSAGVIGVLGFFVWYFIREKKDLVKTVTDGESFIRQTLVGVVERNTTAMTELKMELHARPCADPDYHPRDNGR